METTPTKFLESFPNPDTYILHSPIFKDKKLWRFYSWCFFNANRDVEKISVGDSVMEVGIGQLIFNYRKDAVLLGITEQNARTLLKKIERLGYLTHKVTHRKTVLTLTEPDD